MAIGNSNIIPNNTDANNILLNPFDLINSYKPSSSLFLLNGYAIILNKSITPKNKTSQSNTEGKHYNFITIT